MKQMVMNGAAPFLPEEIMIEILKRLPVKSLMRLQCVCKDWKNLFKTPSFIADHLRHSSLNPSFLFALSCGQPNHFQLRLLDCKMQVRDVQKAPQFDSLSPRSIRFVGSSNGLLCVAIRQPGISPPSFLLWNPATRDVREVPRFRTLDSVVFPKCVLGFGFSPFVNDYKIVAIIYSDWGDILEVDVYSLSGDSWKEIGSDILQDVYLFDESVSPNGAIFWHGSRRGKARVEDEDGLIVSFDIAREVFTFIPWPALSSDQIFKLTALSIDQSFDLTLYEDKLAILSGPESGGFSDIDLWVMEKDIGSSGKGWSWTKKFTSGPCPWSFHYGIIWRNEIVMYGTEIEREIETNKPKSGLCLFNVITNEFKMLFISKHIRYGDFLNYVESLVSGSQHPQH